MLKLIQNTENTVVVTLEELTTIENPFYIFEFIYDQDLTSKFMYAEDDSLNKARYNRFKIDVVPVDDEDLIDGKIYFKHNGLYTYKVYQSPTITLTGHTSTNLVEYGRSYVITNENEFVTYNKENERKTYK